MNMNSSIYGPGMNSNINNSLNQTQIGLNMQPNSFRNVFGILGTNYYKLNLYSLGGVQSLLHIFTSILDLLYFAKAIKSLIIDLLINLLKKIFRLLKYVLTLRWIIDLISKTNSVYAKVIYSSPYFKSFTFLFRFTIISGILACLILKYWKMNQIKSLTDENNKEIKDSVDNTERLNINDINKKEDNILLNEYNTNLIKSEERWKMN